MHPDSLRTARHWIMTGLKNDRGFVVLEADKFWLKDLTCGELEEMAFRVHTLAPDPINLVTVPKDGGASRIAPIPSIRDRLLLTALVVEEYPTMMENVPACYTTGLDYCNAHLAPKAFFADFGKDWRAEHKKFRERTQAAEAAGKTIFQTDVKSFAASCDHGYLKGELARIGWKPHNIATLGRFLSAWAEQGMTGLPESHGLTQMLSKCYFARIDEIMLLRQAATYYRYNDDIRLVAKQTDNLQEERTYIEHLLREAGLSLKPEKTLFVKPKETAPVFRLERVFNELLGEAGLPERYKNLDEAKIPLDVIEEAYRKYISPGRINPAQPHQSLFNYTMNRLGRIGSGIARHDLPVLAAEHGGKLGVLIRYALRMAQEQIEPMHDVLPGKDQQDYFKYLTLSAIAENISGGMGTSGAVRGLLRTWGDDPDAAWFVKAKAAEAGRARPSYGPSRSFMLGDLITAKNALE